MLKNQSRVAEAPVIFSKKFFSRDNFQIKMDEHIARKEVVKPRFRLSTEVRATLERKYDR